MGRKPKCKEDYTLVFMKHLGIEVTQTSYDECYKKWWVNPLKGQLLGLRLTKEGVEVLKALGIDVFEIPLSKDFYINGGVLLFMERNIKFPYYLGKTEIVVSDMKTAVELSLFSGDIQKYGHAKAISRQKHLQKFPRIWT
jgi:hypothetical protein